MSDPPTTSSLWEDLGSLRSRFGFRFSATGRTAAGLVADGRGFMFVEFWRFTGSRRGCLALESAAFTAQKMAEGSMPADILPFDDGSSCVLLARGNEHEVVMVSATGELLPSGVLAAGHVLAEPWPDGSARALVLGRERPGSCSARVLDGSAGAPRALERLPEALPELLLVGGGWLDPEARRYGLNLKLPDRTQPAVLDLSSGELAPLPVAEATLLHASPSGRWLVASAESGRLRLAIGAGSRPPRVLYALDDVDGESRPLTFDPTGRYVAVLTQSGVRTRLVVLDTERDRIEDLPGPGGLAGPAGWSSAPAGGVLRCLSVSPDRPAGVVEFSPGASRGGRLLDDGTAGARSPRWAATRVEQLPGPAGPIEAIVVGAKGWRDAERVVLALHGGPASAWTLKFDQLFQVVAAEGVTIVAPNQRGSLGYGREHHEAIVGAWGGADLADVLFLADHLRRGRPRHPRLGLYGTSYGAFLALLAACAEPEAWDRVVAIAPFLSGQRLYAEAGPAVRRMIKRLGGDQPVSDAQLGPRDVLALLPRLRADLLVVHGSDDPIVPVGQSRLLSEHLTALGRGRSLYREVAGAGHGPLDGSQELHSLVARFLAGSARPVPADEPERR
ncbi:alpha/beta hydrolase family protein [Nonomuraea rubra]